MSGNERGGEMLQHRGASPKVAVIVLNWNGWRDTIECLESLQRLTYPDYRVIVVDNGSTDDSVDRITMWAQKRLAEAWTLVHYDLETNRFLLAKPSQNCRLEHIIIGSNLGFTGGNNVAIEYLCTEETHVDQVLFLNNDVVVTPDFLLQMVKASSENAASIVAPQIRDPITNQNQLAFGFFPWVLFGRLGLGYAEQESNLWKVDFVSGGAMLVKADVILKRKAEDGFCLNPAFFLYCDDLEFCFYAKQKGYRCAITLDAVVYHKFSRRTGTLPPYYYYYMTRNTMLLAKSGLPLRWRVILYLYYPPYRIMRMFYWIVRRNWPVVGAILEGLRDGFAGVSGRWGKHPWSVTEAKK